MNIFLVPYAWPRHFVVGLFCAGVGVVTWSLILVWMVVVGPTWVEAWDGAILLGALGAAVSGSSLLAEGMLRRRRFYWVALQLLISIGVSGGLAWLLYWAWIALLAPHVVAPTVAALIDKLGWFSGQLGAEATQADIELLRDVVPTDVADPSLVSLRYRLGAFLMVGVGTSVGPIIARKFEQFISHFFAGILSGLLAAGVWHVVNFHLSKDLYLAGAAAAATWGFVFGTFAWGIPDELYAGWIRVLSYTRFGRRIPVDALDRTPKERFVGHFPRGLDLFLPVEDGVLEMHVSVAVDQKQRYNARGLTLAPTRVRRFLERVDLRYDPRRPAPLETRLSSGDRITLGEGPAAAELEFLMLPREER